LMLPLNTLFYSFHPAGTQKNDFKSAIFWLEIRFLINSAFII